MTPVTELNPSPAEPDTPSFENNLDPDQLVSKNPADQDQSVEFPFSLQFHCN